MIYVFRAVDGEEIEVDRPVERAPKVGTWIQRGGKRYQRVITLARPIVKEVRHVAYGLPRKWQKTWLNECHDRFDERGRAIFETKAEIERCEGKAKALGRNLKFDPESGVDQSCEEPA